MPDIIAAERQARRLLRYCAIEQLIYARVQAAHAPAGQAEPARARKTPDAGPHRVQPRSVTESCPQELSLAAAYPETIAAATATHASRNSRHDT
jgi:hypothetical protein